MTKTVAFIFALICSVFSFSAFAAEKVMVFAAASTTNMLEEVLSLYNSKGGAAVASYAGSGALARQIDAAAPAAIFISANQQWMDFLDKKGKLEPGTRKNLLGNSLVLIGDAKSGLTLDLAKKPDLVKILNGGKMAIGAPESVPAGSYAKEALTNLGMWDGLQKNLASVENVRVALALVSRGEAPLGVVFGTDAAADKNVGVIAEFPANSHSEISYPSAIIKGKATPEAKKLYKFLQSDEAKSIYKKYGFKAL